MDDSSGIDNTDDASGDGDAAADGVEVEISSVISLIDLLNISSAHFWTPSTCSTTSSRIILPVFLLTCTARYLARGGELL
jgi:hypothetical protein